MKFKKLLSILMTTRITCNFNEETFTACHGMNDNI